MSDRVLLITKILKPISLFAMAMAMAILMVAIALALLDTTKSRQTNDRVSQERATAASKRIDGLLGQIELQHNEIDQLQYRLGKCEAYNGVIPE